MGGCGVLTDIGRPKKLLKASLAMEIVIALQQRAPQAFPKTTGPQEYGDLPKLDFADKASFIDKMVLFSHDLFVVSDGVGNAGGHKAQQTQGKGHSTLGEDSQSKGRNRNYGDINSRGWAHICNLIIIEIF